MSDNCPVCEGRGVIKCADVYHNHSGPSFVAWELARVVACGCREGKAA